MEPLFPSSQNQAINLLGIRIHPLTVPELLTQIAHLVTIKKHALILHVNAHCFNLAYEHVWLKNFLNQAEINFCDGAGVILAARILGYHIPQRITYADWMWQLAEFAETHGFTFFFLGARPGVAEMAATRLRERFPQLCIVGIQHGYFDQTKGSPETEAIIQKINTARPNLLVIGFGMPLQERWLMENWSRLEVDVAFTGGAVFDYISGSLQRGPRWLTDYGLEWLTRLLIEPDRLWRRYLIGNPLFLWRVLKQHWRQA